MAIATLRPSSTGTVLSGYAALGANGAASTYLCIKEASADEDTTYASKNGDTTGGERYPIDANSIGASDTISSVKVYYRVKAVSSKVGYSGWAAVIHTGGTTTVGTFNTPGTSVYTTYSQEWTTKPGGGSWTKSDIDSLQIGIANDDNAPDTSKCTQLYVEVTYTASGGRSAVPILIAGD